MANEESKEADPVTLVRRAIESHKESKIDPAVPTRQEMFERAVRGLASQGWQPAVRQYGCEEGRACEYLTADGRRCAWGWVDPEGTANRFGNVATLRNERIGLAAELDEEDLNFASRLQRAHDEIGLRLRGDAGGPADLEARFRAFGEAEGLAWPEGVPGAAPPRER